MKKILLASLALLISTSFTGSAYAESRTMEFGEYQINQEDEEFDVDEAHNSMLQEDAMKLVNSPTNPYTRDPRGGGKKMVIVSQCGSRPTQDGGIEVFSKECNGQYIQGCAGQFECKDPFNKTQCGYGQCTK